MSGFTSSPGRRWRRTAQTCPGWCSHDHRCGLGEHRSEPLTVTLPGAGSIVLTRVADRHGRQWAEVRASIPLGHDEHQARRRLGELLDTLISRMRIRARR